MNPSYYCNVKYLPFVTLLVKSWLKSQTNSEIYLPLFYQVVSLRLKSILQERHGQDSSHTVWQHFKKIHKIHNKIEKLKTF